MLRRIPMVVWALTVFGFLLSVSASLVVPTYLGFDEPQHVDMVVALANGDGWADPGTRHVATGVAVSSSLYYGHSLVPRPLDVALKAGPVPPRGDRKSLTEYGGAKQSTGGLPNQIVQHPPLYYSIEAAGLLAFDAYDWSYDDLVELLRIVNAVILLPLPLLAWGIARRLGGSAQLGTSAAAFSLAIPGLARMGGIVNNDALMIVTGGGMVLGLTYVATGDLSRRTALSLGLITGLALLSKGFALGLLPLIPLAYVLGARRQGLKLNALLAPLAASLTVAFLSGGFWWARNLLEFGAIQPSGYGKVFQAQLEGPPRPASHPALVTPWLKGVQDRLTRSFWGGEGVASMPTTTKTAGTVMVVIAAVVVLAGIALGMRSTRYRGALALIVLPLPLALAPVLANSWATYAKHETLPGLQGRYLYLAVAGLAVLFAVALDRVLGRANVLLPVLAVLAMLGMQAQGMIRLVQNIWSPQGGGSLHAALTHLEITSPWSPGPTQTVFVLTVVVGLLAIPLSLWVGWQGRRSATGVVPA